MAGLAAIDSVPGLENIDVTTFVPGHMAYRTSMPRLLRFVGWEVGSDEFAEISDPDPDNHEGRQRELIREIEDARKEAQEKPGKRRFGFWKRGKLAEKKSWEMYDEKLGEMDQQSSGTGDHLNSGVLFDVEAIKRELESEHIEVRQLESTLPPMQIDLSNHKNEVATSQGTEHGSKTEHIPQGDFPVPLRSTKSFDATALPSNATSNHITQSPSKNASSEAVSSERHEGSSTSATDPATPPQSLPSDAALPSTILNWQDSNESAVRPELRTANTVPSLQKNAWIDEEDEHAQWSKEGEVVMSFE